MKPVKLCLADDGNVQSFEPAFFCPELAQWNRRLQGHRPRKEESEQGDRGEIEEIDKKGGEMKNKCRGSRAVGETVGPCPCRDGLLSRREGIFRPPRSRGDYEIYEKGITRG
jgi:hypothetical protein